MDARVRELVKATIPVLREHGVALTTYFYQRMFRHNPELNHLFNRSHSETGKQPTALALSVLAYAENIDDPSVLAPVINLIANKHASIGIRAEHYPIVGKHLLASIREVLGEAASDELINAWGVAYGALADVLHRGRGQALHRCLHPGRGLERLAQLPALRQKVGRAPRSRPFTWRPATAGRCPNIGLGSTPACACFVPELGVMQPRQYTLSDAPGQRDFRISVKRDAGTVYHTAGPCVEPASIMPIRWVT